MIRLLALTLAALSVLSVSSLSAEPDANEIVQKANDVLNQETAFAKMKMVITTTSGETRELFFDSWVKDRGDKVLIRYTAPARVKGQAMLLLNNAADIWSYFPRTNRVRKLASHAKRQKMEGSDFSYEDMGSGDSFMTDFDHKLLGEETIDGHACYKIELAKREGTDSAYSKIIAWVEKERYVIWRLDYYEEDQPDVVAKRLTVSDVKVIDGVPTPMKMVMHNLLDGTETSQEFLEVSYNVQIEDSMFTERGLQS
jgi:outer membrane lipoprotein-sorting protein